MHVVNFLYDGGTETYIHTLTTRMNPQIYEFSICCLVEAGFGAGRFTAACIPLHVLSVDRGAGVASKLHNLREIFRLARLMRTRQIDIVHSHDNYPAGYARMAAWLARIPIVYVTYHNLYYWLSSRSHRVNRLLSLITTRIIAVSGAAKDYSMEKDRIPAEKYRVVYNGIDCNEQGDAGARRKRYREEWDIPQHAFVIGNVASLSERKGQALLVEAFARIACAHPQACMVIIGSERDDEPMVKPGLIEAASRHGVADRLVLTGSRMDARDMLCMFDLFVLPSLTEGFGYAIVEAMCAGVPAVASDIPALKEVADGGAHALLFRSGNSDDLADRLAYALANPREMRDMAQRAARAAREKFSTDNMVAGYEAIYREDIGLRIRR